MCGIAGIVYRDPREAPTHDSLRRMADSLAHRGPDDCGIEVLGHVGLAHRRLSVIDTSPAGHQPMSNENRTVWIVYNGESYNFRELRQELREEFAFRSHTDTEVILHGYEKFGPSVVEMLDGMFALAVYDSVSERVLLARDPFGIKPLCYYLDDSRLVFASDLSALVSSTVVPAEIDLSALNDYFDFHWIPAPRSIFKGVVKLPPASMLELNLRDWSVRHTRYWAPTFDPQSGWGLQEWADAVSQRLEEAVASQLVADVPVGVFLSGGIDSSLVAAQLPRVGAESTPAFTMDFADATHSEGSAARSTVARLGVEGRVQVIDAIPSGAIEAVARAYDEPFADSSAIPTLALSRFARSEVVVALSGDGGDELFTGYSHHRSAAALAPLDKVPTQVLRWAAAAGRMCAPAGSRLEGLCRRLELSPTRRRLSLSRLPGRLLRRDVLSDEIREAEPQRWWFVESLEGEMEGLHPVSQTQAHDMSFYLPSDMLVKLDRASMAYSLEVRVPFLSRRVVDIALRIPSQVQLNRGGAKRVLRELAAREFGETLARGKKHGFSVPLTSWMTQLASDSHLSRVLASPAVTGGLLSPNGIRELFAHIARGPSRYRRDRTSELYALFVFVEWHRLRCT